MKSSQHSTQFNNIYNTKATTLWTRLTEPGASRGGSLLRIDGFQWHLGLVRPPPELPLSDVLSHGQPKHAGEQDLTKSNLLLNVLSRHYCDWLNVYS
jgi:hypothetical protein